MVNKKLSPSAPQTPVPSGRSRKVVTAAKREQPASTTTKRPAPAARPSAPAAGRLAGLQRTYRETVAELRKVQWPDRTATRNLTAVVIGMSVALAIVLGGVDALLNQLVQWLVHL